MHATITQRFIKNQLVGYIATDICTGRIIAFNTCRALLEMTLRRNEWAIA